MSYGCFVAGLWLLLIFSVLLEVPGIGIVFFWCIVVMIILGIKDFSREKSRAKPLYQQEYQRAQSKKNHAQEENKHINQDILKEYKAAKSDSERYEAMLGLSKRHKKSLQSIRVRLVKMGVYIRPK